MHWAGGRRARPPAIVTDGGDYINGYMPPQELVKELKSRQAAKAKS